MTREEQQLVEKATRIANFINWYDTDNMLAGEPPLDEDTVAMSSMGSGASDAITVRNFRELQNAIKEFVDSKV